jgi:hypothetical protein
MRTILENTDRKSLGLIGGLTIAALLLWDTSLIYPLKILVIFFHELSHGLAAILSGGEIVRIEVIAQEGGLCITRGGNRFLILSAGYLGSLLWGGAILLVAARTRLDRWASAVLGVGLIGISVVYVRPVLGFGFLFGLAAGGGLLATGRFLSERINDILLRLIGLTSCLYAVADIKSDILERSYLRSDAAMLSELTGVPTLIWGALWLLVAVVGAGWFLLRSTALPATNEEGPG